MARLAGPSAAGGIKLSSKTYGLIGAESRAARSIGRGLDQTGVGYLQGKAPAVLIGSFLQVTD